MTELHQRVGLAKILFLTDFSWASQWAVPFVRGLARDYGSSVTALHVAVPDALTSITPDSFAAAVETQEAAMLKKMARVEKEFEGVAAKALVIAGPSVWSVVSAILESEKIDLICVGTHGRTGLPKMLMGSTAEEIYRRSLVPVITVGPAASTGENTTAFWKHILFASDFSVASLAAAPYAISLAEENDSQLTLMHVTAPAARKNAKQPGLSIAEAFHQLRELFPGEARLWCEPKYVVEHGEAAARILAVARETNADLIVLGVKAARDVLVATHLENSVAHTIVVHAACPVLTVRS
ncbi:MAG TPA: universal stress protein [Candidatus Acidoferrum sp.]